MAEGGFRHGGARDHPGNFLGAFGGSQEADGRLRAVLPFLFLDQEVLIGEGGDLREMSDAKDLLDSGERFELLADGFSGAASDSDIDFIEHESARDLEPAGAAARCTFFDADLKGEQDSGHFAAGGNLVERLEGFARVGGDATLDGVPAMRGPGGGTFAGCDRNGKAGFHGEVIDLRFGEFFELSCGAGPLAGEGASGDGVGCGSVSQIRAEGLEDLVAVFDFGELARGIFAKADDFSQG